MPTRADGVAAAAHHVLDHGRALARLELELATSELRRKAAALGAGVGLLAVAAVVALFGLGFLLATVAAALATSLPTWLALLLVGGSLVLAAAASGAVGAALLRRAAPPVPEQALAEARLTNDALRGNGGG